MKTVAFIPARKGSKGIPGKNKKLFCGKPLVQWSIEQAKDSKLFDKIVVSSDDEDILKLGENLGVTTIERQEMLATDEATLDEVLFDYFSRGENFCDYISLLQPTSPLRTVDDLKKSYKHIIKKKYDGVVGVTWNPIMGWVESVASMGTRKSPFCLYKIDERPNRQTRDDWYLENGAIYWFTHEVLLHTGNRIGDPGQIKLYVMPLERSLEVDSPFEWYLAEAAHAYRPV
jgi:CMP-N-acetylneuraminic acid synthetase